MLLTVLMIVPVIGVVWIGGLSSYALVPVPDEL
jgi:hypothetical protein